MNYKLTDNKWVFNGETLYQIECIEDCKWAKKGELGGYIASYENLEDGGWVNEDAFVCDTSDASCFRNKTMKGLKRTCRTHGRCLGHSYEGKALGYIEARKTIYIPSYIWMLENKCADLVKKLKIMSKSRTVVLLDYDTNEEIENACKPLSHASLIKNIF